MAGFNIPLSVNEVLTRLKGEGYDAYAVGGCVRDQILGAQPKDWDVTTSAKPDEVCAVFSDVPVIKTGIKHGTVTVLSGDERLPVEVTTFRTEFGYSDNRRPDRVEFVADIKEDLSRRDFTMNALAYNGESGEVLDFFGGEADIGNRLIRCVGDPNVRFDEDSLRILRALRFASVLGFEIEKDTAAAIHKKRGLLKNIAAERIFGEFKKLLCGVDCTKILCEFRDVIAVFIPELRAMFDFEQNTKYHCFDVWEHTLRSIDGVPRCAELRAAMLFHDSGKPYCKTVEVLDAGSRTDHYYGHPAFSEKFTDAAFSRLKTDKKFLETVTCLVKYHDAVIPPTEKAVRRWLNRLGEEGFLRLLAVKRADVLAQAPEYRLERLIELDKLRQTVYDVINRGKCFGIKDLAINGNDCIELGLEGVEIGKALKTALDVVIDEIIQNEKTSIINYLRQQNILPEVKI